VILVLSTFLRFRYDLGCVWIFGIRGLVFGSKRRSEKNHLSVHDLVRKSLLKWNQKCRPPKLFTISV